VRVSVGVEVKFQMMDTLRYRRRRPGGLDSDDEGEVGREEEEVVVQLIMAWRQRGRYRM
jgi:hypothetical protein